MAEGSGFDGSGPTFHDLFTGKVDKLRVVVAGASTNAKRLDFGLAVYELNREWLGKILASIAAYSGETIERVIARCDNDENGGPSNRFFRLNEVVAEWVDTVQPVTIIDYHYHVM